VRLAKARLRLAESGDFQKIFSFDSLERIPGHAVLLAMLTYRAQCLFFTSMAWSSSVMVGVMATASLAGCQPRLVGAPLSAHSPAAGELRDSSLGLPSGSRGLWCARRQPGCPLKSFLGR